MCDATQELSEASLDPQERDMDKYGASKVTENIVKVVSEERKKEMSRIL
jgi:hypothetical protein